MEWSMILLGIAALTTVALLIPGLSETRNGATRWLKLGPASFQPAELLKLASVVYLAVWLEKRGEAIKSLAEGVIPFGIMVFIASFVIVVLQRDMGTMMVLAGAAVGMVWVAGIRIHHFTAMLATAAVMGWLAIVSFPHRMSRLLTFLDPERDPTGQGYHIMQALIAVGSGGLFGLGLGKSIQIYGYLPEAAKDSIFAVIAEQFGLIGSILLVGMFGLLAWRGLKVARMAPDTFSRLLASGISLWMLLQAAINIAAMLSLVPLTGIPLPFISYGGSSLLFSMIACGILINISKFTVKEVSNADSRQRRWNSRPYFANPGNARRAKIAR
jgi:cell division protein FtsW